MHPPDLKMLETNSGVRGSGGSFRGKSQASSSNTTEVEAVEASFGLNSQTAEGVQGSKDKDSGAAVDGVNPASGNMLQQEKQKSCALGTVVENGSKKRAHVEAAEDAVCGVNLDNMHQQNLSEENKTDHLAKENEDEDEDEDEDGDEDDEAMMIMKMNMKMKMMMMLKMDMKMKVTVEMKIKMTLEMKMKMKMTRTMIRMAGMNLLEMIVRETKMMILMDVHQKEVMVDGLVVTVTSVLWSPELEVKGLEEANGQGLQIVDFSYTEDSDICGSVDVVNVTPPKDRKQQNHDDDFVDRRFTKSSSETVRRARGKRRSRTSVSGVLRKVTRRLHARNRCLDQSNEEHDSMELGGTLL
ncbi:unnamed protein product [Brassica oleracea]